MKHQCAQNLSFRQINIFLSAARHENLTKAAEELFLTQATVTRNVQELERLLGLSLFVRHKKRMRLTEAGKTLAADLEQLCKRLDKVLDRVYEQQGQHKLLNIGDLSSVRVEAYLMPIADMFEQQHPDIELNVRQELITSILNGVRSGELDAAFVAGIGREHYLNNGVEWAKIIDLAPCAVIGKGSVLYDKETITARDLSECTRLTMADEGYADYEEFASAVCAEAGLVPQSIKYVANELSMATELKRGPCFAIVDEIYAAGDDEGLRVVHLPVTQCTAGIAIIWSKENENPCLPLFLDCVRELEAILRANKG